MDEITTTVEIADETGHSTLQMTRDETVALAERNPSAWIFADGRLVQPQELANTAWDSVSRVQVLPGLVGGLG